VSEGTRHQYGLPVSAFLGGISFTIMAFLIEMHTDGKFHYPMIDNIPNFIETIFLISAGIIFTVFILSFRLLRLN
jgi:hypothetical protein